MAEPVDLQEPMPTHPEEIKTVYDVRIGNFMQLQGSARVTPAGIICAGIATSAILLSVAALIRAKRR